MATGGIEYNKGERGKIARGRKVAYGGFGAGGAACLLVGSDYSWLRSTLPAASKTLSVAP